MYYTDHTPLDRAWFAVAADTAAIREVSFEKSKILKLLGGEHDFLLAERQQN